MTLDDLGCLPNCPTQLHETSPSAQVSLANLLWAAALAQLSPADVQQLLQGHEQTLQEAKRVELVRLLWALGREECDGAVEFLIQHIFMYLILFGFIHLEIV